MGQPVIEAGEIREIQHTRDTQLLRALFLAASGRLTDISRQEIGFPLCTASFQQPTGLMFFVCVPKRVTDVPRPSFVVPLLFLD